MSATLRTDAVNIVIRQIESADGLRVFSTIRSIGGFRFVEEMNIHEPAGPGYDGYWYWERTQESGVYTTEQEAFDDGTRAVSWLQNTK
jgi:hypothetical protein